jgi:signal transduction histidine kinase
MRTAAAPDGAQDQLISIVAHELRNPLVPIRNAAALLRQDSVDADTVRRAAEIIERQVSGMQRLIGDLADVSRMQLGALELRRVRAPLSELIDRAIESTGPMAADRGHSLSVSVTTQPIYLYMDVMRLGQALDNIISNASKYTGEEGSIHVSAHYDEARLIIIVSDTGIGIPEAELEAIFGLFVQAGQGARAEPGLGLGLYLARHFIEAHQGTVSAASAGPGRGSVFTVSLPCEVAVAQPR